jgi:hypothetical protein
VTGKNSGGFDWLAFPHDPDDASAAAGKHAGGAVIRMMPEHGSAMSLWDANGELPDEHDWLHDHLGLSYNLLAEIEAWSSDWGQLHSDSGDVLAALPAELHRARGEALCERIRAEIRPLFTVIYGY